MNSQKAQSSHVKTTVYLPRKLYEEAKLMALLTRSNVSAMIRIALREKINEIKTNKNVRENG